MNVGIMAMGQPGGRDRLKAITQSVDTDRDVSSVLRRRKVVAIEAPPSPELKEAPKARVARLKREVHGHIEEMTTFVTFLLFFTYASLAGRVEQDVFFFQSKVSAVLKDMEFRHVSEPFAANSFAKAETVQDIHAYLEGPFYKLLWTAESFDGDASFPTRAAYASSSSSSSGGGSASAVNERGMVLGQSLLLGGARVSQLRVRGGACATPSAFLMPRNATCYPPFSSTASDGRPFGLLAAAGDRLFSADGDAAAVGADEPGFTSHITRDAYPHGRFAQMLSNRDSSSSSSSKGTLATLQRLRTAKYIDPATRLLLIDYNLYNPNLDVVLIGRLAVELPQSGGVLVSEQSQVARLWLYHRSSDWVRAVAEAVVVLFVLRFTRREVRRVRAALRLRRMQLAHAAQAGGEGAARATPLGYALFGDTGTRIMMANLGLFYAVFATRAVGIAKLPSTVDVSGDGFVSVRGAARWLGISNDINAFNAFLTWMMVFKFLFFIPQFRMLIMVLQKASGRVKGFLCITMITLFACSQAFMLIFGSRIFEFRNLMQSLYALIRMLLGDFDFEALRLAQPVLGPLMFTVFILVVVFVLLNVFIAIVSTAFSETQAELAAHEDADMGLIAGEMLAVLWSRAARVPLLGTLLRCAARRAQATKEAMAGAAAQSAQRPRTPPSEWGNTPDDTPRTTPRMATPAKNPTAASVPGGSSAKVVPGGSSANNTAPQLQLAHRAGAAAVLKPVLESTLSGGVAREGAVLDSGAATALAHSMAALGRQLQAIQSQLGAMELRNSQAQVASAASDKVVGDRLRLVERAQARLGSSHKSLLSKADNTLHISALLLKRISSGGGSHSSGRDAGPSALDTAQPGEDGNERGACGVFGADVGFGFGAGGANGTGSRNDEDDTGITDL